MGAMKYYANARASDRVKSARAKAKNIFTRFTIETEIIPHHEIPDGARFIQFERREYTKVKQAAELDGDRTLPPLRRRWYPWSQPCQSPLLVHFGDVTNQNARKTLSPAVLWRSMCRQLLRPCSSLALQAPSQTVRRQAHRLISGVGLVSFDGVVFPAFWLSTADI